MNSEKLNIKFLSITVAVLLLLVPVLQTIPMPLVAPAYADSMVPVNTSITRSFSVPYLNFMGQPLTKLTESITWYANGTTNVSDSRGNSFDFVVPVLSGITFTLLQNSTTVDQKVVGPVSQYDIYWSASQNKNGVVQKYKLTITGSSVNGTQLRFPVSSLENIVSDRNLFYSTHANQADYVSNNANFTAAGGLGINWSDAIKGGYQMSFDQPTSSIVVSVGKSFLVDPTVVATGIPTNSPTITSKYEGERRVVNIGGNLFTFYYNSSNIAYKASSNGGSTWGTSTLVGSGTGQLATDSQRWVMSSTTSGGTQYVSVVYWVVSGTNTLVQNIRGSVSGSAISWGTPATILTLPNNVLTKCGGSVCAAGSETNDTNGYLFLTVKYLNATDGAYYHQEFKSTDGGNTFSSTDNPSNYYTTSTAVFVLARLGSGDMLLAEERSDGDGNSDTFLYSVYSSTNSTWHAPIFATPCCGTDLTSVRQISADSDTSNNAYITYLTGASSGNHLDVATWSSNGAFSGMQAADTTLEHSLPSITITRDNAIHIYSLNGSKIWETDKIGSTWQSPTNPFGTTFNVPDQLTAAITYPAALWEENSTTPYNLMYGGPVTSWHASTGILEPLYCDPDNSTGLNLPCPDGTTACSNGTFCWQPLVDTRNSHPHVPLFAIINPADGPANQSYTGYQTGIQKLTNAGVIVLGYVDTCTGCSGGTQKSVSEIESEIDKYTDYYKSSGLRGIFLDDYMEYGNQDPSCASNELQCFKEITSYIHGNFTYSIGNPGTKIDQSFYDDGAADKLDIWETSSNPMASDLATNTYTTIGGYLKGNFTMLVYCQGSLPTRNNVGNSSNFASLLFYTPYGTNDTTGATCGGDSNPWERIPTNLSTLASYLDNPSSTITIKSVDLSDLPITGYFDEVWQGGNQVPSAYSPVIVYNGTVGVYYTLKPDNSGTCTFDYWQDNNTNHTPSRTIRMSSAGQTFTAVYNGTCNH